jgi:hypothetical protein
MERARKERQVAYERVSCAHYQRRDEAAAAAATVARTKAVAAAAEERRGQVHTLRISMTDGRSATRKTLLRQEEETSAGLATIKD